MRLIALILALTTANAATIINDKPAAEKLRGVHPLTLQWVTFDASKGSVAITESNGTFHVKGEQKGKDGNRLFIEGEVVTINARDFTFKGKIITKVSYIANGRDCVRDGTFTFRISGARQFWRMKEQQNPCDEAADYVDIYFAKTK